MPPSRERARRPAGKWTAAFLAVAVHLAFVLFLIFNVSWQNRKAEPVTAELYAPTPEKVEPPKPAPEPPKPAPEPPKPAPEPPKPAPEPPKPAPEPPKPPPPSPPPKPDIALKEKQEQLKREQAERERKQRFEAEKRQAEKRAQQERQLAQARERQAREAEALRAQAQRELQAQQKAAAEAARAKSDADYIRRIQAKIRGNVTLPPDLNGNPEAIFDVVQLPTGEIIDVQLIKSSGVRAYDEAVQRAILKSSPLPRPDSPDMFRRSLTLKFRPLD
ncbi:MAG TPA: TonB C-terminal domain-containing protein [Casimicrobiaceae bacterium]